MIDFTRAFDVVDREILLSKMLHLEMPYFIRRWIASFLSNRSQRTKCSERYSDSLPINLGVVQGSAIGPTLFNIMVSDLKPLSTDNDLFKYADDTTLLVPETSNTNLSDEFEAIKTWANDNKLLINFSKTKELVFHRPKPAAPILPPCLNGIERVAVAKLLGVTIPANFSFSHHVDFIISQCTQRMFLLRAFRNRNLSAPLLETVFNAIILSRIIYAVSAWGGFVSCSEKQRVDTLFKRCRKYGYCSKLHSFESLLEHADRVLFRKAQNSHHCLSNLFPAVRSSASILRERGHPYVLPNCNGVLYKRSFINRCLFRYI
jgi:hypothetical protein